MGRTEAKMEIKTGQMYKATVTFKNDHGVFADIGEYNICLALKDDCPCGYYENAKGGDSVMLVIKEIDEKGRARAEIKEVL